jgi:hypothetical protein
MTLLRQHAPSARFLAFVWPNGRSASDVFQTVDTPGKPGHQPGEGHGLTTHDVLTRRAGRAETCLSGSTEARRTNPAFSGFSLCIGEVSGRVIPTFDPILLDVGMIGVGENSDKERANAFNALRHECCRTRFSCYPNQILSASNAGDVDRPRSLVECEAVLSQSGWSCLRAGESRPGDSG